MSSKAVASGHNNGAGLTALTGYLSPSSSGVIYPEFIAVMSGDVIAHGAAYFEWTFAPLSDANYTLLIGYHGLTLNTPSTASALVTVREVNRDRSTWITYNATAIHRPGVDGRFSSGLWRGVKITYTLLEVAS